ncbi:cytochrome P450 [Colletotrichum falcatum]|nr:cytochrome P450 [Colletotrichum falcatum]
MGLVENILEHISLKVVVIFGVAAWWLWIAIQRFDESIRMRRLAPAVRGQSLDTRIPGGIDFIYKAVRATMHHKNVDFWTERLSTVKGRTGETTLLGRRVVFTTDPENIKAILATQFSDYGKGKPFHEEWKEFLGDSIFTTDGEQWQASRQLIRPQFIKDRVSDLHTFESHVQILLKAIANGGALNGEDQPVNMDAVDGKVLDISELFFRYTLDVATDFLLGQDVKSLSTPIQEFAEAFNEVQRVQNIIVRAAVMRRFVPRFSFRSGLKVINRFVNDFIERALRLSPEELASKTKSDQGYTFLHELAGFTRDRTVLRDQIVAVLLAGRDTTAASLSWTLYELGRHPEAVRKLRAEIIEQVGLDRDPTYADLKNMKYLQNVMNETLRLYPAVPFNVRMSLKDTTLPVGGGPDGTLPLAVCKDTAIGYSTLMMQRREDLYPPVSDTFAHPSEFSPERWFNWQPKPWAYIPFNGGPRICIGQQFALTEMGYTLCRLFQEFDRVESYMNPIDRGDPTLKAEIVLQPGDGVKVAFWRADKA